MAMHEHNMVAIGRERKIIIWNIESGSCDQKLSRGKIYHNQIQLQNVFIRYHAWEMTWQCMSITWSP